MVTFIKLLEIPEASLFALGVETKKSKKEVLKEIESINYILDDNKYPEISISNNKYRTPDSLFENRKHLYELFHVNQVFFTPDIRIIIIYIYTYGKKSFLSNNHYQEILHVSRNTVLNDINKLRKELAKYNVEFVYTRKNGYHLTGSEYDIHRYMFTTLSNLLQDSIGEWTIEYILEGFLNERTRITEFLTMVHKFEYDNNIQSIQDRLINILNLIQFILIRYETVNKIVHFNSKLIIKEPTIFSDLAESLYKLILKDSSRMSKADVSFIELLLLGCYEKKLNNEKEKILFNQLANEIVAKMEKISLIKFDQREDMILGIRKHLVPAYYRLKLGFEEVSEYLNVVINQYKNLFIMVKEALKPLQKYFIGEIPDSEVAYFVIHFGGYLGEHTKGSDKIKALVVCPNGISSSLILKEQLSQLFPEIVFLDTHRLNEINKIDSKLYDVVFSTIYIEIDLPFFLVPINLNAEDKKELYSLVYEELPVLNLKVSPIDKIMKATKKYSTIMDETSLRIELTEILYEKNKKDRKVDAPMLNELITEDTFQYNTEKMGWKDAIRLASKPLLDMSYISENYIKRMIVTVEEYGPFINLGKGVAIPHARPEDGVKELSMSMLVLDQAIYLPEDDRPISILIVIAAIDNETHLTALSHLTNILISDESVKQLANAKEYDDIKNVIYQGGEE